MKKLPLQQSFQKLLAKHFCHIDVEVAEDADEGLEKLASFRPDLIFLEIHLAGKSGLKLARRIKSEHPEIIIAVPSSYDLPEYQKAAKESGLGYLIPKVIWTGEDMIKLVESIMTNSELAKQ